jgi:hypothetical protein
MKVDGSCHCGAISFEAEADPATATICHCTDCQKLTGSAFRATVRAPAPSFVLHGTPTIYIKTADSGGRRAHAFCSTCGTPIYSAAVQDPPTYSLRVGTIRQRHAFAPLRQIWCQSALPWSMNIESVEKLGRQ